jgi:predicted membrane metal-binding protein
MIEKIQPLSDSAKLASNRSFGLLFTVVLLIVAGYSWAQDYSGQWIQIWLAVSGIFFAVALLFPVALTPLNKMWFALGLLLGKVVSPVVLGVLFFVVITPVAIGTRLFGRDALLLKKRAVSSYWIDRDPAGPKPESFKDQF